MSDNSQLSYRSQLYERYLTTTYDPGSNLNDKLLQYKADQYARYFGPYLPEHKNAKIFEIGCGPGAFLRCCQQLGYQELRAIDLSPELVQFCHDRGFTQVECTDVLSYLHQCDEQFDIVVMSDVLEHLSKSEALETLSLVRDRLVPGGRAIVRVPNMSNPFNIRTFFGDFTHELPLTKDSLRQVLQVTGYEILEIKGEFSLHQRRLKQWFYDRLLWNAFHIFLKEVMHFEVDVVRGKNLIAVGVNPSNNTRSNADEHQ
jgi:2-polyprenyl-3-methyl-5-hydroxy-6-metoxy-1,4-benzoquinol methylase